MKIHWTIVTQFSVPDKDALHDVKLTVTDLKADGIKTKLEKTHLYEDYRDLFVEQSQLRDAIKLLKRRGIPTFSKSERDEYRSLLGRG